MKRWTIITSVVLACLACGSQQDEVERRSALTEYARQFETSGLVERLGHMEEQLGAIETKLEKLSNKIDSGVRMAEHSAGQATDSSAAGTAEAVPTKETVKDSPVVSLAESEDFELTMDEPTSVEKIVVWHAYRGKEKDAFEKVLKDFTSRFPNFDVDAQEVPFSALRDKIVVTVPRGTGPDIVVFAHNNIGDWLLKGGILVPLSSYIEKYDDFETLATRFIPDTVKALAYDGTLYGLPLAFKSHALFYNKKLVDTPPTTMAELIVMAQQVAATGGTGEDRNYGLVYDAGLLYNHAIWAHAFGTQILDEQGVPHLDTPAMAESIRFVRSLAKEHKVLPDLNDSMATFLFNSGQVGFVIKGPWFLGEIDDEVDYGVALLPEAAPEKPGRPFLGSEGLFLTACAKNKEAAFQVMRFLASDESAAIRYVEGGQLVPNVAVFERADLTSKANPTLKVFKQQAESTVIMSNRPEMQAVWSTMDNALRKTIFGDGDIAEALAEAQGKVAHDIENIGKR